MTNKQISFYLDPGDLRRLEERLRLQAQREHDPGLRMSTLIRRAILAWLESEEARDARP